MLQMKGSSAAVTLLLILFISILFISQIALKKGEEIPSVPQGGDLAVIGGTTAALISALEGAGAGAQVYLFPNGRELLEDTSFLVSEGLAAISTPSQLELEINLTVEDFKKEIQEEGKGVADPRLLEAFVSEADLFYELARYYGGIDFNSLPDPAEKPYFHLSTFPGAGQKFRTLLLEKAEKAGVIFRSEKIRQIHFSPEKNNKKVQMLLLEDGEGETFPFYVQGVILADGGYCGDIHRHHGYLPHNNLVSLRPEEKGEGLRLALELEADLLQTDYLNKKILLYNPFNDRVKEFYADNRDSIFYINGEGQVLPGTVSLEEIADFILRSPEGAAFVLASEEIALSLEVGEYFQLFNTPGELASFCGLPEPPVFPGHFSSQTSYYISYVKVGVDYTPGGLSVTPLGEVKNGEGKIIRGLYAAGEITGGLHGEGMLPGMILSETLFLSGRAGRSAAEYARH